MSPTAKALLLKWESAQTAAGFSPDTSTFIRDIDGFNDCAEKFYEVFEESSGIPEQLVRGMFNKWSSLPYSEVSGINERQGLNHFVSYLSEYLGRAIEAEDNVIEFPTTRTRL